MVSKLKILHLEDVPDDAELVARQIAKGKIENELLLVDNRNDFIQALQTYSPDIVLSDHSLPDINSLEALELLKSISGNIPFILITATVSEEYAVEVMKAGAYDYILKDRLQRLPQAILKAIEKFRIESERERYLQEVMVSEALLKKSEANLFTIFDNTDTAYILFDPDINIVSFNQPAQHFSTNKLHKTLVEGESGAFCFLDEKITRALGNNFSCEVNYSSADGAQKWYYIRYFEVSNLEKKVFGWVMAISDFTDRKIAELQRNKVIADVIKQNQELEQFAYIVSHNLRAPAANILGLANILETNTLTNAVRQDVLNGLSESAKKLDDVILDLSHILRTQHDIKEDKVLVNFSDLLNDIKTDLGKTIEEKNVKIETDFQVAEMFTLKSYLYSIFYNLIVNSIKFRQPLVQPVIKIETSNSGNAIIVLFADNGLGIDLEKKGEYIFGLYKRFHTHIEGKGIGLFMVKTKVETLGGRISVCSEVNEGTEFKINFELESNGSAE